MYNINDFQDAIKREYRNPDDMLIKELHRAIGVAIHPVRNISEVRGVLKELKVDEEKLVEQLGNYMAILSIIAAQHKISLSECCSKVLHSLQYKHPSEIANCVAAVKAYPLGV
jgi:hypothetical protein